MKTPHKLLLATATAVSILAPMVPKSVNININVPSSSSNVTKEKSYQMIESRCDLVSNKTTDQGLEVCEYRCREGEHISIFKTFRNNAAICFAIITEKVKISSR